jgi:hypothetical protein
MCGFTILTAWNVGLMIAIARGRGLASVVGLGMALLALVVVTDYGGVCLALLLTGGSLEARALVDLRLVPGLIHLLGLACFAVGLFVASPAPLKIRRVLTADETRTLRYAGGFLLVLGVGMKLIALGSEGITSLGDYFANVYTYNVSQRKLGEFWDWGTEIAMVGCTLLVAAYEGRRAWQLVYAGVLMAVAFLLTSSRAGIAGGILMLAIVLMAFNPRTARSWLRPRLIGTVLLLLVVTSGVKSQMRYYPGSSTGVHTDWPRLVGEMLSTFGTRFGRAGVYAGYANLVDRQLEDHSFFMQGRVLAYSLTAWVPHVVYPEKPVHPFRDIGYLIRDNFSSRFDTVYAPTLVGFAFADFGVASVITYLFFGGLVLGLLRRLAGEGDAPILLLMAYLHLTLIEGATNLIHNGFLAFVASLLFTATSAGLAAAYVTLRRAADAIAVSGAQPRASPAVGPADA